jgi:hypothetical protein
VSDALRFLRTISVQGELCLAQEAISVRTVAKHRWIQESRPHCCFQNRLGRAPDYQVPSHEPRGSLRCGDTGARWPFRQLNAALSRCPPCFSQVFCVTPFESLDAENPAKYVFPTNGEVAEWLKAAVC